MLGAIYFFYFDKNVGSDPKQARFRCREPARMCNPSQRAGPLDELADHYKGQLSSGSFKQLRDALEARRREVRKRVLEEDHATHPRLLASVAIAEVRSAPDVQSI
jgi:hypothetical protein